MLAESPRLALRDLEDLAWILCPFVNQDRTTPLVNGCLFLLLLAFSGKISFDYQLVWILSY